MKSFCENVNPIKGRVEMKFRNKKTGEVVDEIGDNLVVNIGMDQIIRSFTVETPAGGPLQYVLQSFRLGDDVGSDGTPMAPDPVQGSYTASNQNVVYTVSYSDMSITYPNYYTVELNMVLDGDRVMAQYPDDVDLRFSSAALYSGGDEVFAYRRFQSRVITREISVDIKWSLYFDGQGGI